ncbi:putative Cyclin-dependent kinase 7 [Paratrimastix pyriformis]|uniref:[RNA-polymerase]-subunit kinase n=1 Tax=Paratrimastix pyriformis TaxID=342808 RepID=A0ABQ8UUD1_9EUKA|nr:putative Cyclin-dependent kinase 7 [Paratrimastix pyriformis]
MEKYKRIRLLGAGTYGVVHLCEDTTTHKMVAIKKLRAGKMKDGIDFTSIREIKLLQELKHPNIVNLIEVIAHKQSLKLVFEYMDTDLENIIQDPAIILTAAHIKSYLYMLIRGVEYLHSSWVIHRDLKPNNLFISSDGVLKLGDFGLARTFGSPNAELSTQVITRYYRAPEVLYGARFYTGAVDMWAIGCIFAEMLLRSAPRPPPPPPAPGELMACPPAGHPTSRGVGHRPALTDLLRPRHPTEAQWPGMRSLPGFFEFQPRPAPPIRQLFSAASEDAIDLLSQMLRFDPAARITAAEALRHPFFSNPPAATPPAELPKPTARSRLPGAAGQPPQPQPVPMVSLPPQQTGRQGE